MAALSRDIQEEAQPSTQVENTKDKVGAIFEARGETAKYKTDKVDMCSAPYQQDDSFRNISASFRNTSSSKRNNWYIAFGGYIPE